MDAKADRKRFVAALGGLCVAYQLPYVGEALEEVWIRMMPDVSIDDWEYIATVAPRKVKKYGNQLPDLVELLAILQAGDVADEDLAALAWDEVQGAVGRAGSYRSVAFDDPAIHLALQSMGGWVRFCAEKESPFLRKEFEKLYQVNSRSIRRRGVEGARPLAILPGVHELDGHPKPPVMIGDPAKVAQWHSLLPAGDLPQIEDAADFRSALAQMRGAARGKA